MKKRYGALAAFTLVEVTVVMGIMMAETNNYGDVTKIAYQESCENNLRQIYQGLVMYDMNNGSLPDAKFYPDNPRKDPKSIVKLMDEAYQKLFVCPVFPGAIKDKGLTYIYNDTLKGQSLGTVSDPEKTWLMTELNAVSDKIKMPHPGGFHILYADGKVKVTKSIPSDLSELAKRAEKAKEAEKKKDEKKGS